MKCWLLLASIIGNVSKGMQVFLIKKKTLNGCWSSVASIFKLLKMHAYQQLSVASVVTIDQASRHIGKLWHQFWHRFYRNGCQEWHLFVIKMNACQQWLLFVAWISNECRPEMAFIMHEICFKRNAGQHWHLSSIGVKEMPG